MPMTTIRMAMTLARTGRSMKNFEIIAPRRPSRLPRSSSELRLDLLAWDRRQQPGDDDAVVRLDRPTSITRRLPDQLADLDLALLDDVVLAGDEHIAAALVAADGAVRHQQHVGLARRAARARERNSPAAAARSALGKLGAHRQRAGGRGDARARRSRACPCADSPSRSAGRPRPGSSSGPGR